MTTVITRHHSEAGFTLIELMIAAMLTVVVMGVAFSTFQNAAELNRTVIELTDQGQNLRAGTNLLIRDLLQAGRGLPTGGIAIPSGANSDDIFRPGPEGEVYTFDNNTQTNIMAITTGGGAGPLMSNEATDMISILMEDPFLDSIDVVEGDPDDDAPTLAEDGASMDVGSQTAWLDGDADNGIVAISEGDLLYFSGGGSATTLQTVTRIEGTTIYFEEDDPFNLNQRDAAAGTIMHVLDAAAGSDITVERVYMYTYWVEEDDGVPRMMRAVNFNTPAALAGAVEDLTITYDLVDGDVNPTGVVNLPYTEGTKTYTATQIRKVIVEIGVRSENISARSGDYVRNRVSTTVSIRNLAFVDRYDTDE
jgi:Tfp pilus assembly protein PilW